MPCGRLGLVAVAVAACSPPQSATVTDRAAALPVVQLRPAAPFSFPADTDANSPAIWADGRFVLFNSSRIPRRSSGDDLFSVTGVEEVSFDNVVNGARWMEAVIPGDDGALYGWYHREPAGVCPGNGHLTAPMIGAARSTDQGRSWVDLGVVLEAPPGTVDCATANGYFAGGNGDFSAALDAEHQFVYLYFSTYGSDVAGQGVSVARMAWADSAAPVGRVWKWYAGSFSEPGLGGNVSPFLPVERSWHQPDASAFWGPSVHFNIHLGQWVMLLNHARDAAWAQEGLYVSFARSLGDPASWSAPQRFLEGGTWYPQVIGLEPGQGTDKLAGEVARLFNGGQSQLEIIFTRTDTPPPAGYAGCFADSPDRALPVHIAGGRPDMTPALCVSMCAGAGHAYAGTQFFDNCFCGDELRYEQRPETECDTPCSGDANAWCGGAWRNSIVATGAGSPPPPPPPPPASYLGCYSDTESRALPFHASTGRADMTPEVCRSMCRDAGYALAGAQFYDQCFCGNELGDELRPDGECDTPCAGDPAVACGGAWRNSVYSAP